jgi:autotransporter-associated beta strand protein
MNRYYNNPVAFVCQHAQSQIHPNTSMKAKHTLHHFLALAGSSLLAVSSASAQTDGTWNQPTAGTYDWSDPANWLDGDVAGGTGSTASFTVNAGGAQTVDLNTPVTLGNLTLNRDQNLTITGANALTFDVTTGVPTISTISSRMIRIESVVAGNDGLEITGGGTGGGVALAGANTFTGGIHLNGGSLGINNNVTTTAGLNGNQITVSGTSWAAFASGTNINGGVQINNGANFRTGANNGTVNITGALTGSGTLTHQVYGAGNQTITISDGSAFTGNIDYDKQRSALTTVNSLGDAGRIRLGVSSPFQASREHVFEFGNGGTEDLVFDSRQIEIMGSLNLGGYGVRASNTSHTMVINTDVINSHTGASVEFRLSGGSTQANMIAGAITNGPGNVDDGASVLSIVKQGNGSWTLDGDNTYTGNTTVSAGTLTLAASSSTQFQIGASGVNNAVLGGGTLNLNGTFFFDLTNAGTTDGDSWNIVSVGTLTETYGSTFGVSSTLGAFTDNVGIWSLLDGNNTWTFTESTGVLGLAVIPEPSAALLGSLGFLALLRRRR